MRDQRGPQPSYAKTPRDSVTCAVTTVLSQHRTALGALTASAGECDSNRPQPPYAKTVRDSAACAAMTVSASDSAWVLSQHQQTNLTVQSNLLERSLYKL